MHKIIISASLENKKAEGKLNFPILMKVILNGTVAFLAEYIRNSTPMTLLYRNSYVEVFLEMAVWKSCIKKQEVFYR